MDARDILSEVRNNDDDGTMLERWYGYRRDNHAMGVDWGGHCLLAWDVAGHYHLTEEEAASACLDGAPVAALAPDALLWPRASDGFPYFDADGKQWAVRYEPPTFLNLLIRALDHEPVQLIEHALDGAATTIEEALALVPKEED